MAAVLNRLRSLLSLLGIAVWFMAGGLVQRLIVWPAVLLRPRRRWDIMALYMRGMSAGIFAILRAGGARYRRDGVVPTRDPVLILMNHQSLLDIPTVILMSRPYPPQFVTRRRYARFIPAVSLCLRLMDCPIIEPGERKPALLTLKQNALAQEHGLLIFPEGHRSLDGELRPFKSAGIEIILRARALPVYLVVTDGFWAGRRLLDFVFGVHKIRGRTEVLGPFAPPKSGADLPDFVARMRGTMEARLREMRSRGHETV